VAYAIIGTRSQAQQNSDLHAIFIQGDKIIDSRSGVVIDQCHKETFRPSPARPQKSRTLI
jgi:hypothetical protein